MRILYLVKGDKMYGVNLLWLIMIIINYLLVLLQSKTSKDNIQLKQNQPNIYKQAELYFIPKKLMT